MSDEFTATIEALKLQLRKQEEDVRSTKRLINELCERGGTPILYPDAEETPLSLGTMRLDQFYGQPLATAIRKYLEMRRNLGAATVNDIYAALRAGGFKFEAKNDVNAKRSLYISLAKNSVTFHKLPGKTDEGAVFGLKEWYPNVKAEPEPKKAKKPGKSKKPRQQAKQKGDAKPTESTAEKTPTTAKRAEKGEPHEEGKSADSAARKKHNPAPVA